MTPEMIPPMPALTSPSAMIFPHPEKRFAELTPQGPVSYAFWRWTIRPTNDISAIVEPVSFDYFDTVRREPRRVKISAQRVAYGMPVPEPMARADALPGAGAMMPGWVLAILAVLVFAGGVAHAQAGHRLAGSSALHRFALLDPLARRLRRAARTGQVIETRRAAHAILRRDGITESRRQLLAALDSDIFGAGKAAPSLREFARGFLRRVETDPD